MNIDLKEIAWALARARGCEFEMASYNICGKPSVALVRMISNDDDEFYRPACAWHANRYGPGVPLAEIVAALQQSGVTS